MTVQRLAEAAGISVRTLHVYDEMGLLHPAERSESGYRLYGEAELLRLQQILFYRELGLPLKEIQAILDADDYDVLSALRGHALVLEQQRDRLAVLLKTLEKTIQILETKEESIMKDPAELYQGFSPEAARILRSESIIKYGVEAVEQSEKSLLSMSKPDYSTLLEQQNDIRNRLYAARTLAADSAEVQQLIGEHYRNVRQFWGTSDLYDKQAEQYAGLGQLYVDDPRFMSFDGEEHPDFALFMRDAMAIYAKSL